VDFLFSTLLLLALGFSEEVALFSEDEEVSLFPPELGFSDLEQSDLMLYVWVPLSFRLEPLEKLDFELG